MISTPPAAEHPGLAARLWAETKALHVQAERGGIMARILRGQASRDSYALLLRNLLPAYLALEHGLERHRDTPGVRRFARPETYRAASVVADLRALAGPRWESSLALLPEGVRYGECVGEAAEGDGARLIAHAYTRYLGDLSGGQIMQKLLVKSLALTPEMLSFYRFAQIEDIAAFKAVYHADLDAAGQEIDSPGRVPAEGALAFRLNMAVSDAIAAIDQGISAA